MVVYRFPEDDKKSYAQETRSEESKDPENQAKPLHQWIAMEEFSQALAFNPQAEQVKKTYFIPQVENVINEEVYSLFKSMNFEWNSSNNTWISLTFEQLKPLLIRGIIDDKSPLRINKNTATTHKKLDPSLLIRSLYQDIYRDFKETTFEFYDESNDLWTDVSFEELRKLHIQGNTPTIQIKDSNTDLNPLLIEKILGQATSLDYHTFEAMQFKWCPPLGKWSEVSFKELQRLWLEGKLNGSSIQIPNEKIRCFDDFLSLQGALNTPWKLVIPEVIGTSVDKHGTDTHFTMDNVAIAPFVEMQIVGDLWNGREITPQFKYLNYLFSKVDRDSIYALLLLGELQFYDLHLNNVGIVTEISFEIYSNYTFTYTTKDKKTRNQVSLEKFLFDHSNQNITKEGMELAVYNVTNINKTQNTSGLVAQNDSLKRILKSSATKLSFFDKDFSLGESNDIREIHPCLKASSPNSTDPDQSQRVVKSVIPLKSFAFAFENLRDYPLDEAMIKALSRTKDDQKMRNWALRKDAPIRYRLSKGAQKQLDEKLAQLLSKTKELSFSHWRKQGKNITEEDLQKKFIAIMESTPDHPIFQLLDKELDPSWFQHQIKTEMPTSAIAKQFRLDVKTLWKLNPNLNEKEIIPANTTVIVKHRLIDPAAVKEREIVSCQLHPRITWDQYCALKERQERRDDYLKGYQSLATLSLPSHPLEEKTLMDFLKQIKIFLEASTTPLSKIRKDEYMKQHNEIAQKITEAYKTHPVNVGKISLIGLELQKLKSQIKKECYPTYFNIQKSQYEKLADAYALNGLIYNDHRRGLYIGTSRKPLESMIKQARAHTGSHPNPTITAFLDHFEERLKEAKKKKS